MQNHNPTAGLGAHASAGIVFIPLLVLGLFFSFLAGPTLVAGADDVDGLADQAAAAKITPNDSDWQVRLITVKKLTDKAALAKVALNDSNFAVMPAISFRN